jgi:hypothetical protein
MKKARQFGGLFAVEGMTGIEPAPSVWKTEALPLSYIPASILYIRLALGHFAGLTPCGTVMSNPHSAGFGSFRGVAQLG